MKNTSFKMILFSICIFSFTSSCEHPIGATVFYKFLIKNNSPKLIYYHVSEIYPDTLIDASISKIIGGINPSEQQSFESKIEWPKYFENLPTDTLSIFFFSPDTVSKYGWQQVQSKYLILKRKDISFQDLENSNYLITYP